LQELGLAGTYADGVTAAALNQGAFDAAIAAVNPKAAERYKAAGWQLTFGEDEPAPDVNAEKFIRQGAMKFAAVPAEGSSGDAQQQKRQLGVMTVTSPVLTSKSISETVQQAGQGPQGEAMIAATKVRRCGMYFGWLQGVLTCALGGWMGVWQCCKSSPHCEPADPHASWVLQQYTPGNFCTGYIA
jgi:hypothetical protein